MDTLVRSSPKTILQLSPIIRELANVKVGGMDNTWIFHVEHVGGTETEKVL